MILNRKKFYDKIIEKMLAEEDKQSEFIFEKNAVENLTAIEYLNHQFKKEFVRRTKNNGSPYIKMWRRLDPKGKFLMCILQGSACISSISSLVVCCTDLWLYVFYISSTIFVTSLIGFLYYERRNHRTY